MQYIASSDRNLDLTIKTIKESISNFCIVKRKKVENFRDIFKFDLYKLTEEEVNTSFENETIESFNEKYLTQPLDKNETIQLISIYIDDVVDVEIAELIKVVIFEPNKKGYVKEIKNSRVEFGKIVEGNTEYNYLGRKDFLMICNEVGMLINLPKNRGFHGTFFIVGSDGNNSISLNDSQIKEILAEFDKREQYQSKSSFLKSYFESKDIPRKVFQYEKNNTSYHIGTEKIIEFLLAQENDNAIKMIELEIKTIEENNRDIYSYLNTIGRQMLKQMNNPFM